MKVILQFALIATLLVAGSFSQAAVQEKIIGENDLVLVNAEGTNVPLRYRNLINAFGKLTMGCTATHIGFGYVLTAGHCFWAPPTVQKDLDCSDQKIEWGLRDGKEPYMTSQCEKIVIEQMDNQNDYAILKVSPVPPVAIAPELNRRAAIGDTLTIFSHPNELPLHWSRMCGVEKVQHSDLPEKSLKHKCDTNPGSSGATIINVLSMKVVGIHDGGIGGLSSVVPNPELDPMYTGLNYGTFIMNSPLYDALKELGFN